jgi:tight adherence protein B
MNAQILLISLLFSACVLIMAVIARALFTRAASDYRTHFKAEASASLGDLFLFVDPDKLFRINLVVVMMVVAVTWLATGLWVPAILAAIFMFFLPRAIYALMLKRRMATFVLQLPDALLAIAGAMKAGSSLVQAMEIMVSETRGPISQEFGLFQREMRIGVGYDDALASLVKRVPGEELRLVVAGMRISREIGGNLAETLERIADTLRRKNEMEGKIKALTSQGKLQGLVMSGLPIFLGLVLYQMEPEHMGRLFSEIYGWAALTVIIVMECVGYFFIRKIVSIDV